MLWEHGGGLPGSEKMLSGCWPRPGREENVGWLSTEVSAGACEHG